MATRAPASRFALSTLVARCTVILGAAVAAGLSTAQELPALRAGLWEVSRTIDAPANAETPQTIRTTECTSPNEGMTARQDMLKKIGCKLSPLDRNGNTYSFSAVCGESAAEITKSVLTVENDSAYSIRIDSNVGGTQSQELLRATRVGDCPP